jgi:bisphosphoglycerate-dependent phosphoglycerate mutase
MTFNLPLDYTKLSGKNRRLVREQYTKEQNGKCHYCNEDLDKQPPKEITDLKINWKLFPPGMLRNPIHLQHNHYTGMTEGAVHNYCNAVMWQYEGL